MKTGKTPARKAVREKELITAYPKLFVTDINRAANYYEQKLRPPVFHRAFASLRDGFLDLVRPTNIPDSSVSPRSILSSLFVSIRVNSRFNRCVHSWFKIRLGRILALPNFMHIANVWFAADRLPI